MPSRFENIRKYRDSKGIQYYPNVIYPEIPLSDEDIYVITTGGDRYDTLSYQFYRTMDYWWVIASANPGISDSLVLKPGTQIRIPANPSVCQQAFLKLNS